MTILHLLVCGSRTFDAGEFLFAKLDLLLDKRHPRHVHIISGGAQGADQLAIEYAKSRNISYSVYLPQWDYYGKSAGYRRNIQMLDQATHVVAFWDGESKGTKHTIDEANKRNMPIRVYEKQE